MDRSVIDRLVLSRHLLEVGRQGLGITSDVGLHTFANLTQDAIEVFLVALADHIGAPIPPRADFDKYFVHIDARLSPKELPLKNKLLRLNRIRVNSKHEGILPPRGECESLAISARDFLEQVSEEHLKINFWTATPIDLLIDGEAKDLLIRSKQDRDALQLRDCIINCRKAIYVEIENNYDISQFRKDAPKENGLASIFGPFSNAPYYTQNENYINEKILDVTDFIVIDHAHLDRTLLSNGVDPTMFWNVLRLTPAIWRARDTQQWYVKHDLDLLTDEATAQNADYVLASTIEIVLAIHTKRRSVKSPHYARFEVTIAREGVPIYRKADKTSEMAGVTPPGLTKLTADFDIDGLDGERYWRVSAVQIGSMLFGYVLETDLSFDA